jgi:hypothetical protein
LGFPIGNVLSPISASRRPGPLLEPGTACAQEMILAPSTDVEIELVIGSLLGLLRRGRTLPFR